MSMNEEIVNRVAQSGIITLDLEDFYIQGERVVYDLKQNLFQELILREKDFRDFIKTFDFSIYKDKLVALTCSTDAIVPAWAYMLLITKMAPFARKVVIGGLEELEIVLFNEAISAIQPEIYAGKRVVIKGCSKLPVPLYAYGEITLRLTPYVQSLMFGEPCSTVPVYKKPRTGEL